MKFLVNRFGEGPSCYFFAGPVFHKTLEIGFQRWKVGAGGGLDYNWRFQTRGSHAGLTSYIEFFGWLFEFNVHDSRHWDYDNDCWEKYTPLEE